MSHTLEILEAAPRRWELDLEEVAAAIDACWDCVTTCTACSDESLAEDEVAAMRRCIALCTNCADVCATAARVLSRQSFGDVVLVQRQLEACVRACSVCAEECAKHAEHHAHCAVCAEVCRACEQACRRVLDAEALAELRALAGG
jgi:hypothetical protein